MYKKSIKSCKTIIILFAMCTIKFVKCTISFFFFTNCTANLDFTLCTTWQKIYKMYITYIYGYKLQQLMCGLKYSYNAN